MNENHKTFFDRLVFLPFEDRLDVELAYALGKYWFRSKYRKELDEHGHKIRYFEHMRRAVLILLDELHLADPALIIALLCHDALEDTKDDDLAAAQIEKRFGKDVIWMVKLLSKVPKDGYLERLEAFADWRVLMLKAIDRLDNLRSLEAGDLAFQKKQIEETRIKYYPLFDKLVAIAPKEHVFRAVYLREKIHEIADNFFAKKEAEEAAKRARKEETEKIFAESNKRLNCLQKHNFPRTRTVNHGHGHISIETLECPECYPERIKKK